MSGAMPSARAGGPADLSRSSASQPKALVAIAERCEQATGPDREIDLAIWRIVDPKAAEAEAEGRTPLPWLHCYTSSLDAAMTLVPEGWNRRLSESDKGWWWAELREGYETSYNRVAIGQAPTPALALCAAALRARAAQ